MWLNRKQLVLFLWCRTELYPLIKAVTDTSHFFVPKICILTPVCQTAVGLKLVWCGSTGNTLCFFVLQIYHCHLCLCARMCVCVWCLGGCMCVCMCVRVCVQVIQAWSCVSKYTCVFTSNNESLFITWPTQSHWNEFLWMHELNSSDINE